MIAHKCDLNHANALPLMPTEFSSLFKRMVWSTLSKFSLRRNRVESILPFLVSLTENGDSRSAKNEFAFSFRPTQNDQLVFSNKLLFHVDVIDAWDSF